MKQKVRRTKENWKAFNDDYLISDLGRWYSLKNQCFLKQWPNNKGYMRVKLYINGKSKQYFTHISVIAVFGDCYGNKLPNTENQSLFTYGLSIDHRDFNKNNNSIFNLEIVKHQENCQRSVNHYKKLAELNPAEEDIF